MRMSYELPRSSVNDVRCAAILSRCFGWCSAGAWLHTMDKLYLCVDETLDSLLQQWPSQVQVSGSRQW